MAIKSIVIKPGECVTLPQDAEVTSVIVTGAATVNSTCDDLPEPTSYMCGAFFIWVDCDDNPGHSMDEESTQYTSLKVGNNTYMIQEKIVTGENCGVATPVGTLNLHITDLGIFQFTSVVQNDSTKKS